MVFKAAGLAWTTEMGGLATGADKGELLHVPVQNGLREAQIRADQNLADWQSMQCPLKNHQQGWKDGHWLEKWLTRQRLEVTRWVQ